MARALVDRLGTPDDDFIPIFERAATRNFLDAERLRQSNRGLAAIYLYGYSVEMRIKAAYFRVVFPNQMPPLPLTTRIDSRRRSAAMNEWSGILVPRRPNGPHDIEFWAWLLVKKRESLTIGHPPAFANEITNRAANLYVYWREYIRYRSVKVHPSEVAVVKSEAVWFQREYHQL